MGIVDIGSGFFLAKSVVIERMIVHSANINMYVKMKNLGYVTEIRKKKRTWPTSHHSNITNG